jgi:hypothetical protein
MTYQTTEPLKDWRLSGSGDREAHGLIRSHWDDIDLNPPYQRGAVWTYEQRIMLIRSWLMGIVIPSIVINERVGTDWQNAHDGHDAYDTGAPYMAVIDGKQRLETAYAWFTDDLLVPASWFPTGDINFTHNTDDGEYVRFSGLMRSAQLHIGHQFRFPTVLAHVPTVEDEAAIYLLINGAGTAQTEADLARAAGIASQKG